MMRRKRALDDLGQEIRDHIERETQDNIDKGAEPAEARRLAMIRFGNVGLTMEETQGVWSWPSLDAIRKISTMHSGHCAGSVRLLSSSS